MVSTLRTCDCCGKEIGNGDDFYSRREYHNCFDEARNRYERFDTLGSDMDLCEECHDDFVSFMFELAIKKGNKQVLDALEKNEREIRERKCAKCGKGL